MLIESSEAKYYLIFLWLHNGKKIIISFYTLETIIKHTLGNLHYTSKWEPYNLR